MRKPSVIIWIENVRDQDQNICSLQSDLDMQCQQKLLVSSSIRKELILFMTPYRKIWGHIVLPLSVCLHKLNVKT